MEYQTLKSLRENIDKILKEYPEWENLPLIYATDDEGNDFHKVWNTPTPAQADNLTAWSLEMMGYLGTDDGDITAKEVNCILIN